MTDHEAWIWLSETLPLPGKGDDDAGMARRYVNGLRNYYQPPEDLRSAAHRWLVRVNAPQAVFDALTTLERLLVPKIVGHSLNAPMLWGPGYVLVEHRGRVHKAPMDDYLRRKLS
ncbi:MAG: hypothetical protein AB7L09_02145 [Nitrospira sp.]